METERLKNRIGRLIREFSEKAPRSATALIPVMPQLDSMTEQDYGRAESLARMEGKASVLQTAPYAVFAAPPGRAVLPTLIWAASTCTAISSAAPERRRPASATRCAEAAGYAGCRLPAGVRGAARE
jgi:hypothetical protein